MVKMKILPNLMFTLLLILFTDTNSLQVPIKRHLSLLNKNDKSNGRLKRAIPDKFPYFNDFLTINVQLGTPLKTATLMLMTGSVHTWLSNSNHLYNESGTIKDLNRKFMSIDGNYNVTGDWFGDVMSFEGKQFRQGFGIIKSIDFLNRTWGEDKTFPANGVLGLGWAPYYNSFAGEPEPFIFNFLSTFLLQSYTIYLGEHNTPEYGPADGILTFGDFDYTHCKIESRDYVDLIRNVKYPFEFVSIYYVAILSFDQDQKTQAIIDSGSSTLVLQSFLFQIAHSLILPEFDTNAGVYTVPCKKVENLGNITVSFNKDYKTDKTKFHQIQAKDYVVDLNLPDGKCALAISELDNTKIHGDVNIILGTPFFRSVCVSMDLQSLKGPLLITKRKSSEEQQQEQTTQKPTQTAKIERTESTTIMNTGVTDKVRTTQKVCECNFVDVNKLDFSLVLLIFVLYLTN